MRTGQPLGLDELMIVNPGPSDVGALFFGPDGPGSGVPGLGQLFLGDDGTLYQLGGHFLLGDDGMLYEVVQ
jgi:hypothetical protein